MRVVEHRLAHQPAERRNRLRGELQRRRCGFQLGIVLRAGRQVCGATGYDIVSKDNEEGGTTGGGITNVVSANVKNRSMVIRCK
jgi:hypothetical protein